MYKEILEILFCPVCKKSLIVNDTKSDKDEIIEGTLHCENHHVWNIHDGVINFDAVEQGEVNTWTEMYDDYDYEELDNKIIAETPASFQQITKETKKVIVQKIQDEKPVVLLDIATGRGELFQELLLRTSDKTQIICTDLSFQVLKYDRLKAKKINSNARVSYIACDATKLPFDSSSIDMAVSFFGIANMLQLIPNGIQEAFRVLKKGHCLLSSYIAIGEDSNGFQILTQYCKENNIDGCERYYIERMIQFLTQNAGFESINCISNGESLGEKNDLDLIPFEDEWYRVFLMECFK